MKGARIIPRNALPTCVHLCYDVEFNRSRSVGAMATATTSHHRGRPVIDGGSRGAVGVVTQVAGSSCVNVAEADTDA